MVGTDTFVDVCSGIVFNFTRSVAEHVNPSEAEFNSESFGYNPLDSTGLEWNCRPVDELIYQEYSEREATDAGYMGFDNVHVRIINACSPEDSDDSPEETEDRGMAWKKLRPSITLTTWKSLYFGFFISILSATVTGIFSILVYYFNYQAILICLDRPKESIPVKIQWSTTLSELAALVSSHVWFFLNVLFHFRPHQIKGIKRTLLVTSIVFYVLNFLYRVVLQVFGIYYSVLTRVLIKIPENVLFALGICVQTWVLARHFASTTGTKKLWLFLWLVVSCVFTLVVGILVANFVYPAYNKQDKTGKIVIAIFTPLITVVLKGVARLCIQRFWRISHPGTAFVLLAPLYFGSAVMLRVLQVDLNSWKSVALIGIIHGITEVIERSIVVLLDYLYHQIYERKRVHWVNFRSLRRERLATDIAIMSMLYEASAVISVNGFLHLHEYYYTDDKTALLLLQSFAITTAVPLMIEWFFSSVSIAIETRYQNRPVMAVWRRQWKRHLMVAIINALPIAVWASTSLLIPAVQGRYSNVKDYCKMPFSHP